MIITLKDLGFTYPKSKAPALIGVDASISPGMHLLLGENGAGKTTLLHVIAGLLFPTTGKCMIDDCETRLRLPSVASHVFFTGTGVEFPARNIQEMARIHACFYPHFSEAQLWENMCAFNIAMDAKFANLSFGNLQKAKIAYALALNVDVLLLDEPANGLDIESKHIMQQMIAKQTSPEQTVIVSTHTVADLEYLYDGVIDLCGGVLRYAKSIEEITRRVRFVISDELPSDAIYSEMRVGRYHCIVPNDTAIYSDPDYQLLYMAMRSPAGIVLSSLLTI